MGKPLYASLNEVKQGSAIKLATDDAWLEAMIESACAAIDNYCNRPDGFKADGQPDAREYSGDGSPVQWIDECAAVAKVEYKTSPSDTAYYSFATGDWIAGRGSPERPVLGARVNRPYRWIMLLPNASQSVFINGTFLDMHGFTPTVNRPRGENCEHKSSSDPHLGWP